MSKSLAGTVLGIPCHMRTLQSQQSLRKVLKRIRDHFPADFARLRRKVLACRPLTRKQAADGTQGEWVLDNRRHNTAVEATPYAERPQLDHPG